jgi:hypothetical protein
MCLADLAVRLLNRGYEPELEKLKHTTSTFYGGIASRRGPRRSPKRQQRLVQTVINFVIT